MYKDYAQIRDSLGMTDYEVSKKTGLSKNTFYGWKRGEFEPKTQTMEKIAELFDCPVEMLTTGKMPTYYPNNEAVSIAEEIVKRKALKDLFREALGSNDDDIYFVLENLRRMNGTTKAQKKTVSVS